MKGTKYFFSLILFFFFSTTIINAQPTLKSWYQYSLSAKLSNKVNLSFLSQYRAYNVGTDLRLFLAAPSADYEIYKGVRVGAGFMFLILEPYDKNRLTRYEKRPFQFISLANSYGRVAINHRFGIEQRFLTNPKQYVTRYRYILSVNVPFDKEKKYYGLFRNEIEIKEAKVDNFDSDRITLAFGLKLSKKSAIELGAIEELVTTANSTYIYLAYRNTFNWSKK